LWQEDFEDVDHVVHRRPCLVDNVQTDAPAAVCDDQLVPAKEVCNSLHRTAAVVLEFNVQLVDVWVEDAVHEAYARTLVRILIWQLDVDLPESASERC
jgi:predicted dinucleotide-utilizing enzyme